MMPGAVDTLMLSFHEWLNADEAPAADRLATLIAQSGAVGISVDHLRKTVRISPESLDDLLRALVSSGQVTILKVNGQRVYRATG
jgi:hypothetical protein